MPADDAERAREDARATARMSRALELGRHLVRVYAAANDLTVREARRRMEEAGQRGRAIRADD